MILKVVFANILGGREFLGTTYGEINFGDNVLEQYINAISAQNPDLLSLAEVHLEDETHSEMVQVIAKKLQLPYYDFMGSDKSHLAEGKLLGNAILSKYPITRTDHFLVKSPMIDVDRPNGDHWIMHNKPAQTAFIEIENKTIALTSLHYFPFHHFNRSMNELEFAPQRQSLVDHLMTVELSTIPITTGDFNNKNFKLSEAFPELFAAGFSEAIEVESTIIGDSQQLDHILFKKSDGEVVNAHTFDIPSDHLGLSATLSLS
jgi:endonuclease/exonuclease/phosphatase family metal-dependent hydrolase